MEKQRHSAQGFTLLELAFSLFIVGTVMSSSLVLAQYIKAEKGKETRVKLENISNALSAYAQTHYRLPCPADPGELNHALIGREGGNGKCFDTSSNAAMYWETQGVVPWKELGIPQEMVMDAWNRYITYKPAPNLTVDTMAREMQGRDSNTAPDDIHNACRSSIWYDLKGRHLNRPKALFCCNAEPKTAYLARPDVAQGALPNGDWRKTGIVDTTTARDTDDSASDMLANDVHVYATANWSNDVHIDTAVFGDFSIPHRTGTASPLLRATGPAVTLISHGGNGKLAFLPGAAKENRRGADVTQGGGVVSALAPADVESKNIWPPQMFAAVLGHPKARDGSWNELSGGPTASDDIALYLRTDQVFAKAGNASCESPPRPWFEEYACTVARFNEPPSGAAGAGAALGLQMSLVSGTQYDIETSITQHDDEAGYQNSLGFYLIDDATGDIKSVSMLQDNVQSTEVGEEKISTIGLDPSSSTFSIGLFIVPDGFGFNAGYNNIDMSNLGFVKNASNQTANINDQSPPRLAVIDPVTKLPTRFINSRGGQGISYHLNSNLNPGQANHSLREDGICHSANEMVGPNNGVRCKGPTRIQDVGVLPTDPGRVKIGFEDLDFFGSPFSGAGCYELTNGTCRRPGQSGYNPALRMSDGRGGFLTRHGDSDFDDVTFSFSVIACPKGKEGT